MDRRQIAAGFSLLLAALIWGATFVTAKEAVSQIGVFTFLIQSKARRFTSPTHTALIFATEPVFTVIFGHLPLHESLGWRGLLGCALILAGMTTGEIGVSKRDNGLLSSEWE